jgi:hypothetical protein
MAHGYLGDGYGIHGDFDPDRGDNRDRGRDWRDRDHERGWRGRSDDWSDRDHRANRGMMFGGREGGSWRNRDHDWSDDNRWSDRQDWTGSSYGREHGYGGFQGDYSGGREQGGFGGAGDYSEDRRSYSAHPDDHYRSWRDRHMSELDRDYADYCREREQQFHRDFDQWRRNRQQGSSGRNDEIAVAAEQERSHERAMNEEGNTPTPAGEATLGTNNSENTITGRSRGRS